MTRIVRNLPRWLKGVLLRRLAIGSLLLVAVLAVSYFGFSYYTRISIPVAFSQTDDPRIAALERSLVAFGDRNDDTPRLWSIFERMEHHRVPGVAITILEDGVPIWSRGYGTTSAEGDEPVDAQTLFSMGSVSKVVNAVLLLRVAREFALDLDADVNTYLTSWQVPENEFTARAKVTLRMLLAHTAGFNQHGFADFYPGEPLPSALETLEGLPPAKHGPVRVTFEPGTAYEYSGGGVTVVQVLIEDITGLNYPDAAKAYVFDPLGMARSTFENPLPEAYTNIARSHDWWGRPKSLPRGYEAMPEMAASGLWTNADDMGRFLAALLVDDFLAPSAREEMFTRVKNSRHGLGPIVYDTPAGVAFYHTGANNHYRTRLEGHLASGDGIVIMANGTAGNLINKEIMLVAQEVFDWNIVRPKNFD